MTRPEDNFTSTVDGAAAHERWRGQEEAYEDEHDGYSPDEPDPEWDLSFSAEVPPEEDQHEEDPAPY